MPIDFSSDATPSFRDLSQAGLLLLRRPLVRSVTQLRRLRQGLSTLPETALPVKTAALFRRDLRPATRP